MLPPWLCPSSWSQLRLQPQDHARARDSYPNPNPRSEIEEAESPSGSPLAERFEQRIEAAVQKNEPSDGSSEGAGSMGRELDEERQKQQCDEIHERWPSGREL